MTNYQVWGLCNSTSKPSKRLTLVSDIAYDVYCWSTTEIRTWPVAFLFPVNMDI